MGMGMSGLEHSSSFVALFGAAISPRFHYTDIMKKTLSRDIDSGTMMTAHIDRIATTCVFITHSARPSQGHQRPGFEKPVAISDPLSSHPVRVHRKQFL